ncbi:MAG: D-alanyl-D-alanine carboxypeptidase [Gammaproteobacteria bacterium]|nr:D-alanyl-D-alanine carboxypeptidase [Gammaproteobacteria bacterium]MCY4357364.1 D-alanyl-D-alanine carboxypeptidase [Gammaproteobacteria bacterium]
MTKLVKTLHSSANALSVSMLFCLLCALYQPLLGQVIIPRPPDIAATSYLLIDAKTGHIIVEENADEPLPPASLTKIMTAYIAIEEILSGNLTLDDEVFISEKAWRMEGSRMFVDVNSQVSVEDLLRGIIIQSGNDASVAVAEHIAGSEEAFADMMNQYAQVLGMNSSFFMNASGLDTEEYYNTMSARDLATLAEATIANHGDYYPMYAEREFSFNGINQSNRNTLLFRDSNVDGLKTGWTDAAGYCLVASAERNGMRLISVVMGTSSEAARATETQKLMNYGFRYFETHQLYEADQVLVSREVYGGVLDEVELGVVSEAFITIPRGQAESVTANVELDQLIEAPVAAGQSMGVVNVILDGESLYSSEIVAMHSIEQGSLLKRFTDWFSLMLTGSR